MAAALSHAIMFGFGLAVGFGGIWLLAVWLDPARRIKRAAKAEAADTAPTSGKTYRQ